MTKVNKGIYAKLMARDLLGGYLEECRTDKIRPLTGKQEQYDALVKELSGKDECGAGI